MQMQNLAYAYAKFDQILSILSIYWAEMKFWQ